MNFNKTILLISGIPRAGKTTLGDRVASSDLKLTHVPLDKYIKSIPIGTNFLDWVREPDCIDWPLINEHIEILESGKVCYTPGPDWENGGARLSEGGALTEGPGRKMEPSASGFVIPGTHAFSFSGCGNVLRIYVETADDVIASRLEGYPIALGEARPVIFRHLGDNPAPLRRLREKADLVVSGSSPREEQLNAIKKYLAKDDLNNP